MSADDDLIHILSSPSLTAFSPSGGYVTMPEHSPSIHSSGVLITWHSSVWTKVEEFSSPYLLDEEFSSPSSTTLELYRLMKLNSDDSINISRAPYKKELFYSPTSIYAGNINSFLENGRIVAESSFHAVDYHRRLVIKLSGHVTVFGIGMGLLAWAILHDEKVKVQSLTIVESREAFLRAFAPSILRDDIGNKIAIKNPYGIPRGQLEDLCTRSDFVLLDHMELCLSEKNRIGFGAHGLETLLVDAQWETNILTKGVIL